MDQFQKQESLKPYFANSYGCAVFSSVAKGGIVFVGGAYGAGEIYKLNSDGSERILAGKVDLIQACGGFVLGGEVFSEIIFFETEHDYNRFMSGNFEFSANAKAVALTANVETHATTLGNTGLQGGITADHTSVAGIDRGRSKLEYTKGMKVFTLTMGGLMYEATIGGQKFNIKEQMEQQPAKVEQTAEQPSPVAVQ
jgi:hypothetical protein